jgi:hypothetical protein
MAVTLLRVFFHLARCCVEKDKGNGGRKGGEKEGEGRRGRASGNEGGR